MTANQLETLLCKPVWDYSDVMAYCGFASSKTAYDFIEDLRGPDPFHKKTGWVDKPHCVKRDAVLEKFSTDPKTEMGIAIIARIVTGFFRNLAMAEGGVRDGGV